MGFPQRSSWEASILCWKNLIKLIWGYNGHQKLAAGSVGMEQDARIQLENALLPSVFMEEARFVLGLVARIIGLIRLAYFQIIADLNLSTQSIREEGIR
jgi:hypothetical protein